MAKNQRNKRRKKMKLAEGAVEVRIIGKPDDINRVIEWMERCSFEMFSVRWYEDTDDPENPTWCYLRYRLPDPTFDTLLLEDGVSLAQALIDLRGALLAAAPEAVTEGWLDEVMQNPRAVLERTTALLNELDKRNGHH